MKIKGKLTLTTFVLALKTNKIIEGKKGIFQKSNNDINDPFKKIKLFYSSIKKLNRNIPFYKSNLGVKLTIKYISLFERNIMKNFLNVKFIDGVSFFADSINENIENLAKNYGTGGFKEAQK
ncbi:MAG: hypothetical protein IPM96_16875 [Ignavibacteria bacterium]|nr:hypothetical protein [Ignavibacteria bacterium]